MEIIDGEISVSNLREKASRMFEDLVKAVVDVEKKILAIDAELHSDLEAFLLENGSSQENLWGVNFYPDMEGEDFIEFDSIINIRPAANNKSRSVEDKNLRLKISKIVMERIPR
jgi:hypothetical protein